MFSSCRKYRYKLWRIWDDSAAKAMCVGYNPSHASETRQDPTVTHLSSMIRKLGFGGFYLVNLYGWISPHPEDIANCTNPVGSNDHVLVEVLEKCQEVIVCWGSMGYAEKRAEEILSLLSDPKCFGYNQNGTPYHPMALMYKGLIHTPKLYAYSVDGV